MTTIWLSTSALAMIQHPSAADGEKAGPAQRDATAAVFVAVYCLVADRVSDGLAAPVWRAQRVGANTGGAEEGMRVGQARDHQRRPPVIREAQAEGDEEGERAGQHGQAAPHLAV